ncbi:SLAM family member 7 [Orycteropus afer afer]|uniref:SLAM family member 7 n=1 Tax=Orycteropus afer afer TaxID=1230840 RepID=A0AC54Z4I2_ORYAF|nr:SLAM family member 7 [Orycteropus afer afer]
MARNGKKQQQKTSGPAASGDLIELVGAIGESVTFPLKHSVMQVGSIVWIFHTTLVTLEPQKPNKSAVFIVTQSHKKERVSFSNTDYSLKLSKLQKNDSGIYRVEIHSSLHSLPFTQEYVLHVYEHLSKPKVTIGLQNKNNGTCMVNLTCSMEQGGEDVTYSWNSLGQVVNESHDGSILSISWKLKERNMTFICMARNPISSNFSNPISSWKLCEGAADDTDVPMILLYLVLVPLLCILILGLVILIMQRERRKESIEEKGKERHQEIPHTGPHSGENTAYDTNSYPNKTSSEEGAVNTLYSTVQIPKKVEEPDSQSMTPDTSGSFAYENII